MIRCNNCGWFNLDSAKRCEMCDEELTGLPIENPNFTGEEKDSAEDNPYAADSVSNPVESNPMMETVRLEKEVKVEVPSPSITQTVLDASAVLASEEPVECPKCRYPVFGYAEACPNCGASLKSAMSERHPVQDVPAFTVKEDSKIPDHAPAPADTPQSKLLKGTVREMAAAHAVSSANYARETVREIPKELISNKEEHDYDWCLIPVESPDSETIFMRSGEIIRIGNRTYKFQKK